MPLISCEGQQHWWDCPRKEAQNTAASHRHGTAMVTHCAEENTQPTQVCITLCKAPVLRSDNCCPPCRWAGLASGSWYSSWRRNRCCRRLYSICAVPSLSANSLLVQMQWCRLQLVVQNVGEELEDMHIATPKINTLMVLASEQGVCMYRCADLVSELR